MADPETPASSPPEGWYPDPDDASRQRYWDGERWSEERRDPASADERKNALAERITYFVSIGYRVESQSDFQAVMVRGHRPNHLLHFIIGLLTLGLWWLFVWLPLTIFGGEERRLLTVESYGNVAETKPRSG